MALPVGMVVATLWLRNAVEWWLDTGGRARQRTGSLRSAIVVGALLTGLLVGILANLEAVGTTFEQFRGIATSQAFDPADALTVVEVLRTLAGEWFAVLLTAIAFLVPVLLTVRGRRRAVVACRRGRPPRRLHRGGRAGGLPGPPGIRSHSPIGTAGTRSNGRPSPSR